MISKCIADEEFRRWSLCDQVMYALIGSLVPSLTRRSNADISGNNEDHNESHLLRMQVKETLKTKMHNESDTMSNQVETDAMLEKTEEPNRCDMAGEVTEGPCTFKMTRRSTSKELVALLILHAVSVILGAMSFAYLHETSTEFVTSEIKVKEASRVDLMLAVYIGCPAALVASIVFRAIHSKLGPWRAINKQPPICQTFCPPALESGEEQIKFTLSDNEEVNARHEQSIL